MNQRSEHDGRIRLALAITELDVGGAERRLTQLACRLDRASFAPEVYALGEPPSDRRQLVEELQAADVPVHFLGGRTSRQFLRVWRGFRAALRRQQPHLLQTMLFHANVVGGLAGRFDPRPIVVSGIRVAEPSQLRLRCERWATRRARKIVCVSDAVAEHTATRGGIRRDRLLVIPNGVHVPSPASHQPDSNQPEARRETFGVSSQRRLIVAVGRLHRQKGLDWLLTLLPKIFDELPLHDLLLVGAGPEEHALRRQAAELRIAGRVHFAGWRENVEEALQLADLLVLPSRWEGMPNVLLEAMAQSLPVVATDVEGVRQILGPLAEEQVAAFGAGKESGKESGKEFAARVITIASNEVLASRLGAANQARVREHFSIEAMVAAYARLYQELIATARQKK